MRKTITYFFLVAMIFALCSPAFATEYPDPLDSRNVPENLVALANPGEGDILFRYYNIPLRFDFTNYDSIEAILENATENSMPLYALETSDGQRVVFKTQDNGISYKSVYDENGQGEWANPSFQEHITGEAIRTVSPDIIIESMYYLKGENSKMGTAIYYKTNLGDYVFFDGSIDEYLFSAEAFFEYQRALYAEAIQQGDKDGSPAYSSWDLSAYDYRSDNFDPHAPFPISAEPEQTPSPYLWIGIAAGAVVLTAIAAFFIVKAKRKAAILPEEA